MPSRPPAATHPRRHRSPRVARGAASAERSGPGARSGHPGVDDLLARARARFTRLHPVAAARLLAQGRIVLVDTRTQGQREAEGIVPGALVIDRNVLEWRLDPACAARLPIARYDLPVVVMCAQGYSSSLAAASLQDLGLDRATDVVGGFQAWKAAGLPTRLT